MSEIEDRITTLIVATAKAERETYAGVIWGDSVDCINVVGASIINPWNMAVKALENIVAIHTTTAPNGGQDCLACGHSNNRHYDYCFIAPCEVALAAMKGEIQE